MLPLRRHLFSQVAVLRPEDSIDFAAKFFRRIQSCHHVLGAEYAYIGATSNNRRAFIFCLMEIFASFSLEETMSTAEYEQVCAHRCSLFLRFLCPVYSMSYVLYLMCNTLPPPSLSVPGTRSW